MGQGIFESSLFLRLKIYHLSLNLRTITFPIFQISAKPEVPLTPRIVSNPESPECGVKEKTRIVGGTEATPGDWPWAAIVGKPGKPFFQVSLCVIL